MADVEVLKKIVEQARKDPKFFHALVFDPERALGQLDFLDRSAKAALLAIDPETLIQRLIGRVAWCGETCGSSSCIDTCGQRSCDNTCGSSCGTTCSHSCGETTQVARAPAKPALPTSRRR